MTVLNTTIIQIQSWMFLINIIKYYKKIKILFRSISDLWNGWFSLWKMSFPKIDLIDEKQTKQTYINGKIKNVCDISVLSSR